MVKWIALSLLSQGERSLLTSCSALHTVPLQAVENGLLARLFTRKNGSDAIATKSAQLKQKIDYTSYLSVFRETFPVTDMTSNQREEILPQAPSLHPADYAARAFLLTESRLPLRDRADEERMWQLVKPHFEVLCCVPFTISFNGTFISKQQLWPLFNDQYSLALAAQLEQLCCN